MIVGQDPYPIPGVATGIPFGVNKDCALPPTLGVILDELCNYYSDPFLLMGGERTLEHWVQQGVLLLNASMTCDDYTPEDYEALFKKGTHSFYWRYMLMEKLFEYLSDSTENTVFVFLGRKAQYYSKYINLQKHTLIEVAHPTADWHTGKDMFRKSGVFNHINETLEKYNKPQIEWLLDLKKNVTTS